MGRSNDGAGGRGEIKIKVTEMATFGGWFTFFDGTF